MNGEISGKFLGNDTDICYNERLLIIDMRNEVDPCNTRRTRKKNTSSIFTKNSPFLRVLKTSRYFQFRVEVPLFYVNNLISRWPERFLHETWNVMKGYESPCKTKYFVVSNEQRPYRSPRYSSSWHNVVWK